MPRILDLFCGAGGACEGYRRAGFEVVGVDIVDQPRYPGAFVKGDACEYLYDNHFLGEDFSFIHASPPCQAHSTLSGRWGEREYPDLIISVRKSLDSLGVPYVIENVPGAPVRRDLVLCGSMFGLGALCRDGEYRQLRRHRWFEFSDYALVPEKPGCCHDGQPVGVYGTGGGGQMTRGYKGHPEEYVEAMGMPWATRREIAQAIPPAYTEHIGRHLIEVIR